LRASRLGHVLARAAQQLGELAGDLLVAPRQGEELEDDGDELGLLLDVALQGGDERIDDVIGVARRRELVVEEAHAQLAVAAHDLGQQPLLGPEVVVQQPAGHARLARDVIERRARHAAPGDARAHRLDDALGLLALDGAVLLLGCGLHVASLAGRPAEIPQATLEGPNVGPTPS
jgi:hypothetical protein